MTLGSSHVHKARTVINSNYLYEDLNSLSGWSNHTIKHRIESCLAFARRRDHRSYSRVLANRSDSGYKVAHGYHCVYQKNPVLDLVAR